MYLKKSAMPVSFWSEDQEIWSALYSTSVLFCSADSELEDAVVEVIDHHLLQRPTSPSCPITVEPTGSCATLVTERIAQKSPDVLDQQVAQLLYGECHGDVINTERNVSAHSMTAAQSVRHQMGSAWSSVTFSRRRYLIEMWDVSRKITSC